jgi:tetratricopeptide (TPR) repeat protein
MNMTAANKLELHYLFNDDSHTMDAFIRNKCESELLAIINEIKNKLGFDFHLEAEALREGGLREIWKAAGKNSGQISIVIAIIALIISIAQIYQARDDELDIELKKLSIEEKKLSIQKLKQELEQGIPNDETIKDAAMAINNDFKVITRKSNFYKQLDNYDKVIAISFNSLSPDNEPVYPEQYIPRSDFHKFILNSNELPEEIIENAEIEIVAPVLKEGRYRWKGIYQDELIGFNMNDSDFKDDVLSKRVSFQHGTTIQCVLKVIRELDEAGEIVTKGYIVQTVLAKIDGEQVNETSQGKRYKYQKKFIQGQNKLFENNDQNDLL